MNRKPSQYTGGHILVVEGDAAARQLLLTVERALHETGLRSEVARLRRHLANGHGHAHGRWLLGVACTELWSLERLEREYILAVLRQTGGHRGQTADILGIDRRTLYRKLKQYVGQAIIEEAL